MKKKCFIFLMVLLFGFHLIQKLRRAERRVAEGLSLEQADLSLQENTEQSFPYSSMITDVMVERPIFPLGQLLTVSVSR